MRRALKWLGIALFLVVATGLTLGYFATRHIANPPAVHETQPPELPAGIGTDGRPAILLFSKTTGYRHEDAIPACSESVREIAARRGWAVFETENGATFNPAYLERFRVVFFNNVSGDVFNAEQRAALRSWIETGGGFVGVHGSGGDLSYDWRWYVESLIGAQFIGHIMTPQFQTATVRVEERDHPATAGLDESWSHEEEWYSFARSPRERGVRVLASVDESSYDASAWWGWQDLQMGDHPVIWSHCVGRGRSFYSALGHQARAYATPQYRQILEGAIDWAASRGDCGHPITGP
jgi:type 1 glutamine amidotransferase